MSKSVKGQDQIIKYDAHVRTKYGNITRKSYTEGTQTQRTPSTKTYMRMNLS